MKKSTLKIFVSFVFLLLLIGSFSVNLKQVKAEQTSITYVALGDSIADGTMLAGYSEYTFVENAYTSRYKNYLESLYTVNAHTYAMSGSNTTDLLSLLNGVANEKYEQNIVDSALEQISNANLITICIGANDILLPAIANISDFIMGVKTRADIENILSQGLSLFEQNFPEILLKLTTLNANATIIFNNVYNPYKNFELTGLIATFAPNFGVNVDNVNSIDEITETYLAGGTDSQGTNVAGLNATMASLITSCGNQNIKLVDVKSVFDNWENLSSQEPYMGDTITAYSSLVNADSSKISVSNFNNFSEFADPHPTALGHKVICEQIKSVALNFSNPIEPEVPTNVTVTYVTNGGKLYDINGDEIAYETIEYGTNVEFKKPIKNKAPFAGWYVDSNFATKWNFDNDVTENITLYAKWIKLKCLDENYKNQYIDNPHDVEFEINVLENEGFDISWYVNNVNMAGKKGKSFVFTPEKTGTYSIKCIVDGVSTEIIDVVVGRKELTKVSIVLKEKDVENNYVIEILDNTYNDKDLVWFKSDDNYDDEAEIICIGKSILDYHFDSNCSVWLAYNKDGSGENYQVISNVLKIETYNNIRTDVIIGGLIIAATILTLCVMLVFLKKKNKI